MQRGAGSCGGDLSTVLLSETCCFWDLPFTEDYSFLDFGDLLELMVISLPVFLDLYSTANESLRVSILGVLFIFSCLLVSWLVKVCLPLRG